jgi:manganese/zinc/iron transport system ATP- binding protein
VARISAPHHHLLPLPQAAAPPATPLAVEVRGLTLDRGGLVTLSRVSLSLPLGAMAAIVGPAGAGKSSLLRCLLGRLAPRAGEVFVLGERAGAARERLSYLPPDGPVDWRFPLSVLEVVLMGRYRRAGLFGRIGPRDRALAQACLADVGLAHLAERRVADLSRAQRQRAILARAFVQEPELLLLDEPLADVDAETADELFSLLARLPQRGKTVIVATRGLGGLVERFDQVVLLNGQVVAQGRPAEVLTEANLRATYGARTVPLEVPAEHFAVDAGSRRR